MIFAAILLSPPPFREGAKLLDPLSPNLTGKHWTETISPVAYGFVADIDPTAVQKIFDITKQKGEPNIQYDRQADDFGAGFEALEGGRSGCWYKLRNRAARLETSCSDKTSIKGNSLVHTYHLSLRIATKPPKAIAINGMVAGIGTGTGVMVSSNSGNSTLVESSDHSVASDSSPSKNALIGTSRPRLPPSLRETVI